ncbi:GNAT family N-acetyltransferase [archaeon]|jgi:[ribosomal protein S5]-alanine N-acetyltransferase|nr:GNAT family N-acetyltransferase [archaeon]MBT6761824.1 GNAT family N-acetyltransferase [archaeon]
MSNLSFLPGKRIYLRPQLVSDINQDYLSWLNDPEVNLFSGRRLFPTSEIEAKKYLSNLKSNEAVLAICTNSGKHIGNIKFGPVKWIHRSAEISIIIGDRTEWNKGYAKEAIYLLSKHLFNTLGLNRVEAGTVNPAFQKSVEKIGWKQEGILKEAFFFNNSYKDVIKLSILKSEFQQIPIFEKNENHDQSESQIQSKDQSENQNQKHSQNQKQTNYQHKSIQNPKYKAAVIGCGNIASGYNLLFKDWPVTHCAAFKEHPQTSLVAVSDIDENKAKKCKEDWGAKDYYTDHKQMLQNQEIDIVSICTPFELHTKIIQDVVQAKINGKNIKAIFCEKPFAANTDEANKAKKLCEENNIILAINFQRRHDKLHQHVKINLADLIGQPKKAIFFYAGGISNNGSHAFDLLEYYFGDIKSVESLKDESEDQFRDDPNLTVQVAFNSGVTAILTPCTIPQHSLFELEIIGTKGKLELINKPFFAYDYRYFPNEKSLALPTVTCSSTVQKFPIPKDFSRSLFTDAITDIIETVEAKEQGSIKELISSAKNGVRSLELVSAAIHSSKTKQKINMPFNQSINLPKTNGVFTTWKTT